jgi:hypothetical protein
MTSIAPLWQLMPHACVHCLGRVLRLLRQKEEVGPVRPAPEYRCAVCGAAWTGAVEQGCACGIQLSGRDANLRCVGNAKQTSMMPAEIVVRETVSWG